MKSWLPVVGSVVLLFFLDIAAGQGDFNKGVSYYKQGQFEKAVQEFEQIVRDNPEYEAGYRVLGDSYLRLKRYREAARAFRKSVELDGTKFVSYRGAATAEFNLKQFQDAVATLLKGEKVATSPQDKHYLFQLRGSAYYSLGRYREAAQDLEQAVSLQRGSSRDYLQLGISYYQMEEFNKARPALEQVIALDPTSDEARQFLSRLGYWDALAAIRDGRYSEASTKLTEYVSGHPGDGEAWYNLGLALLFSEDFDEAQRALQQSAQLLPNHWETFDRLGYLFERNGEYQAALANYRKALELNQSGAVSESVARVQERIRRSQAGNG